MEQEVLFIYLYPNPPDLQHELHTVRCRRCANPLGTAESLRRGTAPRRPERKCSSHDHHAHAGEGGCAHEDADSHHSASQHGEDGVGHEDVATDEGFSARDAKPWDTAENERLLDQESPHIGGTQAGEVREQHAGEELSAAMEQLSVADRGDMSISFDKCHVVTAKDPAPFQLLYVMCMCGHADCLERGGWSWWYLLERSIYLLITEVRTLETIRWWVSPVDHRRSNMNTRTPSQLIALIVVCGADAVGRITI